MLFILKRKCLLAESVAGVRGAVGWGGTASTIYLYTMKQSGVIIIIIIIIIIVITWVITFQYITCKYILIHALFPYSQLNYVSRRGLS